MLSVLCLSQFQHFVHQTCLASGGTGNRGVAPGCPAKSQLFTVQYIHASRYLGSAFLPPTVEMSFSNSPNSADTLGVLTVLVY